LRQAVLADPEALLAGPASPPGGKPSILEDESARQAAQEREAIAQVLAGLVDTFRRMEEQQNQRLGEMQQAAVELAMAVASRLIHDKLEGGEIAVEKLVLQVLDRLGTQQGVKVYLHPADLALLEKKAATAGGGLGTGIEVQLLADPTVGRGGCRAEGGEVSVLSQMEVQLAEIRKFLLGALGNAETERRQPLHGDSELRRFPDRRQTA
jgi:flagellar assembly protein FliH